jgi:hypothetical protein
LKLSLPHPQPLSLPGEGRRGRRALSCLAPSPGRERAGGEVVIALALVLCACGTPAAPKPVPVPPPPKLDLVDPSLTWPRFVSTRFGVTLALPDGKGWKIDDHKKPYLYATHEPTHSVVVIKAWSDDALQSRQTCETTARLENLFPDAELVTAEEVHVAEPPSFDTRLLVAVETHGQKGATGHVIAIGGYIRRCLFFHFWSDVPAGQEDLLLTRLALARTRIFGQLQLGNIDTVPREKPPLP